jgi:hypothetical protein
MLNLSLGTKMHIYFGLRLVALKIVSSIKFHLEMKAKEWLHLRFEMGNASEVTLLQGKGTVTTIRFLNACESSARQSCHDDFFINAFSMFLCIKNAGLINYVLGDKSPIFISSSCIKWDLG